ncbi:unnamed protein product [Brugia timori]|uniref:ULP_PROTEASE domain-containing protein n=1 Tax=Brugia timori TaxID=42155 RepID=A0A0R3QFJ7_9BILA|nr:unnamed protein product [Brugia timori]
MITSAWHHDPKSRPAFADILPNIEKYASPVKSPNGVPPSNTADCGLLSVSKLKNHWERKGIPQGEDELLKVYADYIRIWSS